MEGTKETSRARDRRTLEKTDHSFNIFSDPTWPTLAPAPQRDSRPEVVEARGDQSGKTRQVMELSHMGGSGVLGWRSLPGDLQCGAWERAALRAALNRVGQAASCPKRTHHGSTLRLCHRTLT